MSGRMGPELLGSMGLAGGAEKSSFSMRRDNLHVKTIFEMSNWKSNFTNVVDNIWNKWTSFFAGAKSLLDCKRGPETDKLAVVCLHFNKELFDRMNIEASFQELLLEVQPKGKQTTGGAQQLGHQHKRKRRRDIPLNGTLFREASIL